MAIFRTDRITVHVSSDEMSALLSISAKGPEFPSRDEVNNALSDAGVVKGIDQKIIDDVLAKKAKVHERVVARGSDPDPGLDDEIIWAVNISNKRRPSITVEGKADFKKLNQFETVKAGDEILSLLPGRESQAGFTVTGKTMEAPGQREPLVAPSGKNTHLSEDGLTLYASIDGAAMLRGDEVIVDNVLEIDGDVSFNTGNINYRGTVIISGDIRSGFRVEATESIIVHGSVEAAELYSKNGSISIENGVLGRGRAKLLAGADLECGFLQDATASVKGNVVIKHYAINSNITSGGKIMLIENEGLIRGGKTVAEKGIEILEAGSERNILTEMVLSRSDMGEDHSKLWRTKIKLAEEFQHLDSLCKRQEFLDLLQQRLGSISEERELELKSLEENIASAEEQVERIRREVESIEEDVMGGGTEHVVHIHKQLNNKVTVRIGHKKYFSSAMKGDVTIYRKGDDLRVEAPKKVIGNYNEK